MYAATYKVGRRADAMGIAFVPFTFPTYLFCKVAEEFPYNISWGKADAIWNAYHRGVKTGAIKSPGKTNDARSYLMSQGFSSYDAGAWLATAEVCAERWWGQGTWFEDFGASPGFFGAVEGVVSGLAEAIGGTLNTIGRGILGGFGLPKWLFPLLLLALLVFGLYFFNKKRNSFFL